MNKNYTTLGLIIIAIGLLAIMIISSLIGKEETRTKKIVYGVSPYQDTILPIVADKNGWYKEKGLEVDIKVIPWDDVPSAVASGAVDVAILNFNSFQATHENIVGKGGDMIFYYPLFVFKGAAIMVKDDGQIKPLKDMLPLYSTRDEAIIATIQQLKGKKVAATKGTEMEQIVLSALERAGLKEETDVQVLHAGPDEGLRGFLRGEVEAYSGGVTERTEAKKQGAIELIESSDLLPPVIDGLVTSKKFAEAHEASLQQLIELWFRTIEFMEKDLDNNAKIVIDYLSNVASTKYTLDEYKYTWFNTEVYPKSKDDMNTKVIDSNSPYYWKKSWDANNEFLLQEKKIIQPVSYEAFWGEKVQRLLEKK